MDEGNRDYVLKFFEVSDFQDFHGNYWVNCAFEGVSEPVTWVMQAKTIETLKEGATYFGEVKVATSKAGKPYNRFYRGQVETSAPPTPANSGNRAPNYVPKDSDAIKAQWAIGRSVELIVGDKIKIETLEQTAKRLYALVDVIKDSNVAPAALLEKLDKGFTPPEEDVVAEFDPKEEIDLSQIPF